MAHDVFISYSSKDKEAAEAVCAKLESEGIKCWIAPRDIPPSARYAQSIINGINASRLMIFIFSSHANDSEHVESEIDRAYNKRIPIIPLRIEDLPLSGSLEYYLSTAQWFDALPPIEKHLERLPKAVRQLLDKDNDSAPEVKEAPPRAAPAKLDSQAQKPKLFGLTPIKIIAGLGFIVIVAAALIVWFLAANKTEIQVTGKDEPATTGSDAVTSTNEIIVDSRNKLIWTKNHNGADTNWQDAVKYCEDLSLGGFNDWRLPSRLDLYATNDSDIAESDRIWKSFQSKEPCCYWTSTEENESHALAYNLKADVQSLAKTDKDELRALCVHHAGK